jgi:hypothetical protein
MANEAATRGWTAEEIRSRVQHQLGKPNKKPVHQQAPEKAEHVTRNMLTQDIPPKLQAEPRPIPALVTRCRSTVQDTLQLLRSAGAGTVDSAYAAEFLQELEELQALLEEAMTP